MNTQLRLLTAVFVTLSPCHLVTLSSKAWAQPSSPHIGFVYPAGGQRGTTFQVSLGGQYLDGPSSLHVSGSGVQARILRLTKPLTEQEKEALREKLQELRKTPRVTTALLKEIDEIRQKLAKAAILPTPALAEIVTVEMTIDARAALGPRELRLSANTGMSNPVVFHVGQLPEITRKKDLIDPEAPQPRSPDIQVTLPGVLNGQILPGQVDRYRFAARKGQQLVFRARARALIPYLADAVPGWFQAALTLRDAQGNEVAYSDHFRFHPDPVLAYRVPSDGEYVLEIRDTLYRGREDFVYRLEAGELPFITSIFPPGGRIKTRTVVNLEGWNLPAGSLTLEPADMKPGILPLSVRQGDLLSNRVPFAVGSLPECLEQEPNDTPATAQRITLPIIINGRIGQPGDRDVFRFEGRAGQTIIAEVRARRLDSPLDSVLELTDASGKVLAFNDDHEDRGAGLHTHHADSLLRVRLPSDGTYYLHLSDAQRQGSAAHVYRLRVSIPQPDFELRVTPCSINVRPGATVAITVHALRKDGFSGDINLFLKHSPHDFALGGARVPANQDVVRLTLHVPATARPKPVHLVLEGRASIGGRQVTRTAVPAEDQMQAFAYHHLVPANDMMVIVSGRARARFPARLLGSGPIKIRPGGTTLVQIAIPRGASGNKIKLVLNDPPEGITLRQAVVNNDGAVVVLHADAAKVKPGARGNLILEAYPDTKAAGRGPQMPLGTLPAMPFVILRASR
jgi:hypothetical protein